MIYCYFCFSWSLIKLFVDKIVYDYPRLQTNTIEHQTRMLERMLAEGKGRIHGYSSEWDYEKVTGNQNRLFLA